MTWECPVCGLKDADLEFIVEHAQNVHRISPGVLAEMLPQRGRKLDSDDVKEIKQRLADGENHTSISDDFDVSLSSIRRIKEGSSWGDIEP